MNQYIFNFDRLQAAGHGNAGKNNTTPVDVLGCDEGTLLGMWTRGTRKWHNVLAGDGPDFDQLSRNIRGGSSGFVIWGNENEGGN